MLSLAETETLEKDLTQLQNRNKEITTFLTAIDNDSVISLYLSKTATYTDKCFKRVVAAYAACWLHDTPPYCGSLISHQLLTYVLYRKFSTDSKKTKQNSTLNTVPDSGRHITTQIFGSLNDINSNNCLYIRNSPQSHIFQLTLFDCHDHLTTWTECLRTEIETNIKKMNAITLQLHPPATVPPTPTRHRWSLANKLTVFFGVLMVFGIGIIAPKKPTSRIRQSPTTRRYRIQPNPSLIHSLRY